MSSPVAIAISWPAGDLRERVASGFWLLALAGLVNAVEILSALEKGLLCTSIATDPPRMEDCRKRERVLLGLANKYLE